MHATEFASVLRAYTDIVDCEHLRVPEKVALLEELIDAARMRALTPAQTAAVKRLGENPWRSRGRT
jgi:hypothetical protein